MTFSEKEMLRADYNEKSRQFIQNAIELALSIGDFQKEVHCHCSPAAVVSKTAARIGRLINFESSALYLVDEDSADIELSICTPSDATPAMEAELDFLIQEGFVAWAIRERRGITVFSKDGTRQIMLHAMSTYLRTRGLFMGVFPAQMKRLPDASLEILSIILRNSANAIESLSYSNMLEAQMAALEKTVEEKTRRMVHYEKQLIQAQNMEAIAALAGGVAHQFNNALTGLIGNLDLISISVGEDSDIAKYVARTRPITERMSNLTSQLLAYAQGGRYVTTVTSFKSLLMNCLPAIRRTIKDTVQIHLEAADDDADVKVDMIQIRMAISAIVNNAAEAIEAEGRICLKGFVIQHDELPEAVKNELKAGEYACLCVQDTGKGMDEGTLRRIFEPFFSTKFEGRGLTMAAVFGIIKNHHGWITASSKPGEGTDVRVYLPVIPPSEKHP